MNWIELQDELLKADVLLVPRKSRLVTLYFDVYEELEVKERIMNCQVCEQETSANDLRFGVCWDCATAESIIDDGTDMYDNGLNGKPAQKPMDKVRLLLARGWRHGGFINERETK